MAIRARSAPLLVMIALGGALVTACSAQDVDQAARPTGGSEMAGLPVPEAGRGGVTGMPDRPGPGAIGTPEPDQAVPPDYQAVTSQGYVDLDNPHDASPDPVGTSADGATSGPLAFPREATAQDAVAVMHEYYAALESGNFAQGYRLWSQDGAASGQSLQQFADSIDRAVSRRVELMTPGRIDAASGSRYVEVPLAVEETGRDGRVHRYAGAYTLGRTIADDASAEQRAWRIISADLRAVRP